MQIQSHAQSSAGYFNDLNNGVTNGWDWYEVNGGRQDFMNYFRFCGNPLLNYRPIRYLIQLLCPIIGMQINVL